MLTKRAASRSVMVVHDESDESDGFQLKDLPVGK